MIETYALTLVFIGLVVGVLSLAYGWWVTEKELREMHERSRRNWVKRQRYNGALWQIVNHPVRNNGSALKKIAKEALDD